MTVLVDFRIATERFKLGEYVELHGGLVAELERIVPTEDYAIPYVWATGPPDQLDALAATFEASESVSTVAKLDRLTIDGSTEEQQLYRVEWVLDELDVIRGIVETEGVIMEGQSTDTAWRLRFRFPDHEHVADFYQFLADNDITDFAIHSVYELQTRSERSQRYDLTPEQREAVRLAAERGYFDTPRETTLEALGEELDVSEQAVSQRIRRANRKIVHDALNRLDRPE